VHAVVLVVLGCCLEEREDIGSDRSLVG
jgi:hypothetical protein